MSSIRIELDQNQTTYQPGQEISGTVSWQHDRVPKNACVRLIWYTQGKGTEDAGIAEKFVLDLPQPTDQRRFEWTLPAGPYSFSGRLISLIWAVELEVDKKFSRTDILVAPDGQEIVLGSSGGS